MSGPVPIQNREEIGIIDRALRTPFFRKLQESKTDENEDMGHSIIEIITMEFTK